MHAAVIAQRSWELLDACRTGRLEPVFLRDIEEAQTFLGSAEDVRCVIIDHRTEGMRPFLAWLRGHPRLLAMPVVALVDAPRTTSYLGALSAGADDAVAATDAAGLAQRVAEVGQQVMKRPAATKGRALVAHPDARVRRLVGRHLRSAGFDPVFAQSEEEIGAHTQSCKLVVASVEGVRDPVGTTRELRGDRRCSEMPVVWLAPQSEERLVRSLFTQDDRVAVSHNTAPGDNLLFRVNELMAGDARNGRDSHRLLVSTICEYRLAGERHASHGLTYNVSQNGLYIRTLAPLPRGVHVWMEMRPLREGPWVHLRGRVVWARRPCDTAGAPPGFGVRLDPDECPKGDLQSWYEAYRLLLEREKEEARPMSYSRPAPVMGAVG